jgi:hypothetical protein
MRPRGARILVSKKVIVMMILLKGAMTILPQLLARCNLC